MNLEGKRIVIVGGASGIGFAVAEGAIAEGAEVVIGSSRPENVQAAGAKLGNKASGHPVDVKVEDAVAHFFEWVGPFDHLVFTAGDWGGFRSPRPLAETDLDAAAEGYAVRHWGALKAIKHGAPRMREGGSVVLTNGMIAHRPQKGRPISTAMAGGIEHLVSGLAVDLAPIRVNAACPGAIRTGVWDSIPADAREAQLAAMTRRLPIPRVGEPAEVAEAYLYLLKAGYTTGQVLLVDGGGSVV
jgi:NAD(P)-dependent dehydrogenase (short-subunit alcohol dehydrogenase family)